MTAGSVVLCYNLPDGPSELKLSRKVYVDIFLGKIETWADPRIQQDNPDAYLPEAPITVVRRSDGSGTTYAFTNHLNSISQEWKKEGGGPGKGKSVTWPVGVGGKGNSGVAALIEQTPGAIGYLEFGYAELLLEQAPKGKGGRPVNVAVLENRSGQFVKATQESGRAALSGPSLKNVPADLHIELPDPEAAGAYPIVTYTWLLCSKHYDNERIAANLKDAIRFCLTDGQKISAQLGYLPLPDEVRDQVLRAIDQVTP
jgi:phosphate transport system substrate-binding protein